MASRFQVDPLVIDAGSLRHSIEVQNQVTTQDEFGGQVESWVTVLSTRAGIKAAIQREAYQAGQFTAEVSHIITIRWPGASVTLQGGQQVVFGARVFKLQTVENVLERDRVLHLMCLEINGVQA